MRKYLYSSYVLKVLNILFCTADGSIYGCAYEFEDLVEVSGGDFKGELKMGGCFDTHQNFTGSNAGKWCFCDDSDGCNGSGFIQLSLTLISLVAMRFAF